MKYQIPFAAVILLGAMSATAQVASSHVPSLEGALPPARMTTLQVTGKTVARVNGVALIDRDLLREMYTLFPYAQQHNGFPKELEPDIRRGALQMIVFEELVYQEAKRRKMTVPPAKLASAEEAFRKQFPSPSAYRDFLATEANGSQAEMRQKIRRSLLIEALLDQEVTAPSHVTLAQARAQYQKNLAQYQHGEILHIQSISIVPPNDTPRVLNEAKQRAEEAAKLSRQAKTYHDFGLLAEKLSDDDFHVNMGDHRPHEAKELPPPIVQAAAKMKTGEVSDLIQLGNNYTIFRLESRKPAGTTPFAEVKAKLQSEMQKQNTEQIRSAFARRLRQNAKIEML